VKNGQIFAHKSTARGGLDLEYLDETSRRKASLRERADMEQQIGKKLKHFTDYASKETLGQVHAGGFLHHSIRMNPDGTSTAPSQLSNAERKQRITQTWQKHLARFPSTAKRPVIAHRLVFSMSKEQHDALAGSGISPDQVLHSRMKKVMRRFNERFHSNDSIGYAYGIHHDTANLHVHVAICPRTENGSYVGCSMSRSSQSRHKKQMDCIKSWFEIENSRWEKTLGSPQKLEETLSKRLDADRLIFSPKLNHLQMTALRCAQNSDSIRLQQLYQSIRNLEASLANKRRGLGAQYNGRFVSRLLGHHQSRATQLVAKIGTTVERRSLREVQSLLFKLKRQYRTLHKRYSQIYGFSSFAHQSAQYQQLSRRASLFL
jgi:hypothetical protein